jgi:hypothetical protein
VGIYIDVNISGPIWEGRAPGIIRRYRDHLLDALGDEAIGRIRAYLPTQYMYLGHNGGTPFRNPVPPDAGRLEASIHSYREAPELAIVTDDPIIYGPWIEGIAIGNTFFWPGRVRAGLSPRFPGYHTFRIITGQLVVESGVIADREIQPFIVELNT